MAVEVHDPRRTRTFGWPDPSPGAKAILTMSGLEYLQAVSRGDLPTIPIAATLGFDQIPIEVAEGKVTFFLEPQEFHYNPIGSVHGGVITTLLDSASACAVHSLLPAGTGYTSLEIKVSFMRAVRLGTGVLRCEGSVLSMGRRVASAEARLVDSAGKLYAHATTTCLILEPGAR